MAGVDLEALAIVSRRDLTLYRRERPESAERAAKLVSAHVIERPHVLGLEAQMRLCNQGFAVGSHEPEILDRVGDVPPVIAVFPFTATPHAAPSRRGAPFLLSSNF